MPPLRSLAGTLRPGPGAPAAPAPPAAQSFGPWVRAALLALLAACAAARLAGLGHEGLWEDEIRSARLAALPFAELLRSVLLDHDFAVPLLHLAATKAGLLLGHGEFGLRLPSALFGVAGMGAVYLLGREAYGAREGWIAACFLALSHEHLYYSREARPYTLLVLAVSLMLWALLRAARTRAPRDWALAGFLAALGCNAHFLGAFPALAAGAAALGLAWHRRSLRGIWLFALPFLALAPVWFAVFAGTDLFDAAVRRPLRLFEPPWSSHLAAALGPGEPALFALTACLAGAGLLAAWRGRRTWLWVALLQLVLPVALLQGVPFAHGFAPRYLLFLLPVLAVLQARGLTFLAARLRGGELAQALAAPALVLLHLPAWGRSFEPKRSDWRGAAEAVAAYAPERTVVLSSSAAPYPTDPGVRLECLGYYLGDADGFSMPHGQTILAPGTVDVASELQAYTHARPVCALLTHGDRRVDLPYDLDALSVRGITLLFPRQTAWSTSDQAALLLVALAHAAEYPPEAEGLFRGALELARASTDAEARAALAGAFTQALAVRALAVPLDQYPLLLRLDWLLSGARSVFGELPPGPALWALHQRVGQAHLIAAQHAHAAGSLLRETRLVLRAYELGALTRAEVNEVAERHRAAPHPEPPAAEAEPGTAAPERAAVLAQLPR